MKTKYKLEWYVLNEDYIDRKIKPWNIFRNIRVDKETRKLVKQYNNKKITREQFKDEVRRIIMCEEWARCEYEILCTTWPSPLQFKEEVFKAGTTFKPMFDVDVNPYVEYRQGDVVIWTKPVQSKENVWEEVVYQEKTIEGLKTKEIKFEKDTVVRYVCKKFEESFIKVDCYEQILPNLDALIDYILKQAGVESLL